MNFKSLGRKIFNGLPIISLIKYNPRKDTFLKRLGHSAYAIIVSTYVIMSFGIGTPSISKWYEIDKKIKRERLASINQLYDRAINCVEQDGIPGLSSLGEINKLYSKAGVSTNVGRHPIKAIVDFPILRKKIWKQ